MKRPPFKTSKAAELAFGRQLKKIARASGHIVEAHVDEHELKDAAGMMKALTSYSKLIEPWARRQAAKVLTQIQKANKRSFKAQSKTMGKLIKRDITESDVGFTAFGLMQEQVGYIQSIPLDAGVRAQELAFKGFASGKRASEIAKELRRTTEVSESDALRIARTETAKANSFLTQSRAQSVGSTHYIWRTSGDAAVRESHRKMEGKIFAWNSPPTLSDGTTGNPGTFPNCRCYPEPVFGTE